MNTPAIDPYVENRVFFINWAQSKQSFTFDEAADALIKKFGSALLGTHDPLRVYMDDLRLEGVLSEHGGVWKVK